MAEKSPAFSWYPRDWFASESFNVLPLAAQAAYRNLLDHSWEKDGLPPDERILQRLAGASKREWHNIWPLISRSFIADQSGRLRNPRLELEREKQRQRSASAQASAERRWEKGKNAPSSNRSGMRTHSERTAQAVPTQCERDATQHDERNANGMLTRAFTSSSSSSSSERDDSSDHRGEVAALPVVVSSSHQSRPVEKSGAGSQLSALGVIDAWNRLGPKKSTKLAPATLAPESWHRLRRDVAARSLADWESVFRACSASDFLAGELHRAPIDFWTALKQADEIAAGKYATWAKPTPAAVSAPLIPPYPMEEIRRSRAEAQAELAAAMAATAQIGTVPPLGESATGQAPKEALPS